MILLKGLSPCSQFIIVTSRITLKQPGALYDLETTSEEKRSKVETKGGCSCSRQLKGGERKGRSQSLPCAGRASTGTATPWTSLFPSLNRIHPLQIAQT